MIRKYDTDEEGTYAEAHLNTQIVAFSDWWLVPFRIDGKIEVSSVSLTATDILPENLIGKTCDLSIYKSKKDHETSPEKPWRQYTGLILAAANPETKLQYEFFISAEHEVE